MNTEKCKAIILLVILLLSGFHFGRISLKILVAAQGYISYKGLPA
jgi:hypothetical protein